MRVWRAWIRADQRRPRAGPKGLLLGPQTTYITTHGRTVYIRSRVKKSGLAGCAIPVATRFCVGRAAGGKEDMWVW